MLRGLGKRLGFVGRSDEELIEIIRTRRRPSERTLAALLAICHIWILLLMVGFTLEGMMEVVVPWLATAGLRSSGSLLAWWSGWVFGMAAVLAVWTVVLEVPKWRETRLLLRLEQAAPGVEAELSEDRPPRTVFTGRFARTLSLALEVSRSLWWLDVSEAKYLRRIRRYARLQACGIVVFPLSILCLLAVGIMSVRSASQPSPYVPAPDLTVFCLAALAGSLMGTVGVGFLWIGICCQSQRHRRRIAGLILRYDEAIARDEAAQPDRQHN